MRVSEFSATMSPLASPSRRNPAAISSAARRYWFQETVA